MNPDLTASLLRSFASARLSDKVLIATALHYAKYNNPKIIEKMKPIWTLAIKIEIDIEHIIDLYRKGLADYTDTLKKYEAVAEFIVMALGEAFR